MSQSISMQLEPPVFEVHPNAGFYGLLLCGVTVIESSSHLSDALKTMTAEVTGDEHNTKANQAIEFWKGQYKRMGLARKHGVSSFESLYKRFCKTQILPKINSIVDLYNSVSLKNCVCIGAYDLDQVKNFITVSRLTDEKQMQPIGQAKSIINKPGSVVYQDEDGVICSYWNYRDVERTSVTTATKNLVFTVDIGDDPNNANAAIDDLLHTCTEFFQYQSIKQFLINNQTRQLTINLSE